MSKLKSPWAHLPQPLQPGQVIPSNRCAGEYHWTFRCAKGETYHYRVTDYALKSDAELDMRKFCARHGNAELAEYLDAEKHPGSGRGFMSPRLRRASPAPGTAL